MGENTGIQWTDATVNFWWGCTKVGPGCDHCYAEVQDHRFGGAHWGTGVPRRKIKGAVKLLHRLDNDYAWWNADHSIAGINPTSRRRVFIQSMSDIFDTEVPVEWFEEAWSTIEKCGRVAPQILTKRVSVVEKRLAAIGRTAWPRHAGLMITVVNQDEADRDIPRLLSLKHKLGIPWVGLSCEPLLGPIDLKSVLWGHASALSYLDWAIGGGESGPGARPVHPDWARSLRDQCVAAEVPWFWKQWGDWLPWEPDSAPCWRSQNGRVEDRHALFPADMDRAPRWDDGLWGVGEGLSHAVFQRVGKKAAGRLLDGRQWNELPEAFRG